VSSKGSTVEISLLRSLTRILANKKRKVVRTPGFVNHPLGVECRLFNLCGLLPNCTSIGNVPDRLLLLQLALRQLHRRPQRFGGLHLHIRLHARFCPVCF